MDFFRLSTSKGIPYLKSLFFLFLFGSFLLRGLHSYAFDVAINDDIRFFSSIKDRSSGSHGAKETVNYIAEAFKKAGLQDVNFLSFDLPVPRVREAFLEIASRRFQLYPLLPNLVVLSTTPPHGIEAKIVYAGRGEWLEVKGKDLKDTIVFWEADSSEFWLHAAALGAKALVYLGSENDSPLAFSKMLSLAPLSFPRFWVSPKDASEIRKILVNEGELKAKIVSSISWKREEIRNVYGFIVGRDERLRKELVILEAPYDSSGFILGNVPGMDEATSIITLLNLSRYFGKNPPKRSILFVSTGGKGEYFAGTRTLAWEMTVSQRDIKREMGNLKGTLDTAVSRLEAINRIISSKEFRNEDDNLLYPMIVTKAKDLIDDLVGFGAYPEGGEDTTTCTALDREECLEIHSKHRLLTLRSIVIKSSFKALSSSELRLARRLMKEIRTDLRKEIEELKLRLALYESFIRFKKALDSYEIVMALSLNVSTLSPFVDIKQQGTLFPLRDDLLKRNRISSALSLARSIASSIPDPVLSQWLRVRSDRNTTPSHRPSYMATYPLSSDPLSIAGFPALAIVPSDGISSLWGTPLDTLENWNGINLFLINDFFEAFLPPFISDPNLKGTVKGGPKGLATLDGSTMFIRKGELFPDRPASGTLVSVMQGNSLFRAMSYHDGSFSIPGVANRRVSYHKLIVEPYGLRKDSGSVAWAANKRILRKESYRVQVAGRRGFTTLVMFPCVQTDVFNIFKPQSLSPLTKATVLDAITETTPSAFWYSRIDGTDVFNISIFMEKNRRFKLLLSDSLMAKDVLFLNAGDKKPEGVGFVIGKDFLNPLHSALDMSLLVGARLSHLERHGVIDQSLEKLYLQGRELTERARKALENLNYAEFWDLFSRGWAALTTSYRLLDKTQRDVLAGVMFFIVLLVPFAYCLERFLFCFVSIYHQIIAFMGLLMISVTVIGWLHPAFALTYSPPMVIIAFLVMGLALMVIWIIFTRFEQEITSVRRSIALMRGAFSATSIGHIRPTQALAIAIDIGASNLHRRPLRTILTCSTIIILTFTIMSFTSLKSIEKPSHVKTGQTALYTGVLVHNPLWFSLGDEAWRTIRTIFQNAEGVLMPRSWLDPEKTESLVLRKDFSKEVAMEGVLGLSHHVPPSLAEIIIRGRWLSEKGDNEILIPSSVARELGISFETSDLPVVNLRGRRFVVSGVFDEEKLNNWKDLNGKPILPFFIEHGSREELREVEVELMESGVEFVDIMSRFRNASPSRIVIVSHETCLKIGGELKAIGATFDKIDPIKFAEEIPFTGNLSFFAGREGKEAFEIKLASSFRYQGLTDVVIPILIVIAICFNTLIGHVQERKREIAVYTSIGLAPRHVGMLFIVEALSLAVLSSVFGYIVAQFIATFGRGLPLFADISLNYSSLASVMSLLLIFATVFMASIYPAVLATRMAMPDVERGWTLPEPQGNVISVDLPFLFRIEEHYAVMKFLEDFIREHQEAGTGVFLADDLYLSPADEMELTFQPDDRFIPVGRCFLIQFSAWLAPFDFGIQQRVRLYCCPARMEDGFKDEWQYVQFHIHIERLSGEANSWYRANRHFVRAIRKAILRWHSLKPEEKAPYVMTDYRLVE
ncbi:MAG: hypothetical protein N2260_09705 [Syntrophobacterales bacterium]|nr:hypothetical protein [Syntrophobacterales bacterium]